MSWNEKLNEEQRKEICKIYQGGLSMGKIAKIFKVAEQTIRGLLIRRKIEIRGKKILILSDNDRIKILELYNNKTPLTDIAILFNCHSNKIKEALKESGIEYKVNSRIKYETNHNYFDVIDTEDKAYFLGLLYADGCNHKDLNDISIALKLNDKDILIKLAKFIYPKHWESRVKETSRERDRKDGSKYTELTASVSFRSKRIKENLTNLGMVEQKSLILQFPTEEQVPGYLMRHFIRGYFDGDGSIKLNQKDKKYYSISFIGTKEMMEGITNIIKNETNLDYVAAIKKVDDNNDKNTYSFGFTGNRKVRQFCDWMYKDASIYLERKHGRYISLLERLKFVDNMALAGTQGYSKSLVSR